MSYQPSATNGGAVADATDSFDMMDKLIDFLDGTTAGVPVLPVGERWTVNKDDSVSVPGERFVYLEGPGLSGTDNIHVNIRIYSDIGNNLHNWEIRGATGFSAGLDFENQPGGCTFSSFFTLSNANMPFWFVVSGRRIIIVAQTAGSVSYACYLGWYLPYATPAQFPYPMFNGGSAHLETTGYLTTNYMVGNFYDGPQATVLGSDSGSQLRDINGQWLSWGTFDATTSGSRPQTNDVGNFISPFDGDTAEYGFGLVENVDSSFILLPLILYSELNSGNVFGEIDGAFFSPLGQVGKKFPDTITVSGDTYLVVNNAYRTTEANALVLLK